MATIQLTPQQQESLKTLRAELTNEGIISGKENDTLELHEDHVLLRFLRARKFNVKQSKTMIMNCIKWRETVSGVGIDEIYRRTDPYNYPERAEVFKHWPIYYHKTDKAGRALNIQHLGRIEPTALFQVVSPERHWESLLANAESLTREVNSGCSVLAGQVIDDVLCIVDLKGFSLTKFWQVKNVIRDSFQISQDYYPETLGHLAVINAPYGFSTIWAAVRPWVAKETQDKVHILGSDYQSGLLELVDAENLPESIGGKCTCAEYGGCELSKASPWMLDRERRRETWLRGERKRAGLHLDNEEDVKLVREHYGKNLNEFKGKEKQVDDGREVSSSTEKDVSKDVVVIKSPVPPRVEATVN